MSPRSKTKKGGGHRKYRQRLEMGDAVIAGDERLSEVVYCYRFPTVPGRIKIGYSSRGLSRVVEQSTSFPEKPEVIFVIHDKRARMIEGAFHEALAHRQADVMGTEWFDADWKDLLAVSPILRKALGRDAGRRWRRRCLWVLLGLVCMILYPPLAMTQIAMSQDVPPSLLAGLWREWASLLGSFDPVEITQRFTQISKAALDYPMPFLMKIIPVIIAAAPMGLPLVFRRRQAF